jgi:hypothetical protein
MCGLWPVRCGQLWNVDTFHNNWPITQNTAWVAYRALTTTWGWQPYAETWRERIWNVLTKNPLFPWAFVGPFRNKTTRCSVQTSRLVFRVQKLFSVSVACFSGQNCYHVTYSIRGLSACLLIAVSLIYWRILVTFCYLSASPTFVRHLDCMSEQYLTQEAAKASHWHSLLPCLKTESQQLSCGAVTAKTRLSAARVSFYHNVCDLYRILWAIIHNLSIRISSSSYFLPQRLWNFSPFGLPISSWSDMENYWDLSVFPCFIQLIN